MKKRRQKTETSSQSHTHLTSSYLLWPLVAIVLLHFIGVLFPQHFTWGFNFWGFLPQSLSLVVLITALVLLSPFIYDKWTSPLAPFLTRLLQPNRRKNRVVVIAIGSILLFALFYVFRSRAHVYGDGFTILAEAADLKLPQLHGQMYVQILSLLLHHYSTVTFNSLLGFAAETTFAIVNSIGGVVGIWALYRIATLLTSDQAERWFILVGSLSSGAVILFFGYIEHYTWAMSIGLWSVYWLVKHIQHSCAIWPSVLFAVLASAFHLVALPFLAATVVTMVLLKADQQDRPLRSLVTKFLILILITSFTGAITSQFAGKWQVLVPLWPVAGNPYWFLSLAHLIDMVNLIILIAPFGVVAAIVGLISSKWRTSRVGMEGTTLAGVSAFAFLAAFWIDPTIGAARDWDLLAVFGFPLSLWGVHSICQRLPKDSARIKYLPAMLIVMLICIIPNLIEKNDLNRAVVRLDTMLWHDAHYQKDYRQAERCLPWGHALSYNVGDMERSVKYF
ncbi:MAG: hypothetical protein KAT58_10040 [candidate division Zixibacteria bacterium]|nr:hypothetical protein [candidate division Zixibacteria bacterium]